MLRIAEVRGRQILDSRGNPTVEVDVRLEDGTLGRPLTQGEQAQVYGTMGAQDTIQFQLPPGPQTITLSGGALAITHTVTFSGGTIDSGAMAQGSLFSHTFTTPGTYPYICTIHPFMHGTVVVNP